MLRPVNGIQDIRSVEPGVLRMLADPVAVISVPDDFAFDLFHGGQSGFTGKQKKYADTKRDDSHNSAENRDDARDIRGRPEWSLIKLA